MDLLPFSWSYLNPLVNTLEKYPTNLAGASIQNNGNINVNMSALLIFSCSSIISGDNGDDILLFSLKYSSSVISGLKFDSYKSVNVYSIPSSAKPYIYPSFISYVIDFLLGCA